VTDPDVRAKTRTGCRTGLWSFALAAACSLAFGLTGCRTIGIGAPVTIQIPQNLTEEGAQSLVTESIDRNLFRSSKSGPETRKRLGHWQIEQWEPGYMVVVYSWRKYILRVNIAFENRTTLLEIGKSEGLLQSATRIHKRPKRLAMELAQEIRLAYAKIGMRQRLQVSDASQRTGLKKSTLCISMWGKDPQEQANCQRAQRRSYDRLRPLISQLKVEPAALESKRLRACYEGTQVWAGADWEAVERCFYK
jgi:hypothetical protein